MLDCGSKAISAEHAPPELEGQEATLRYLAEEHAVFDAGAGCTLDLGDRVRVRTGHCCATTNLHRVHHVVAGGVVIELLADRPPLSGTVSRTWHRAFATAGSNWPPAHRWSSASASFEVNARR